MFVQPADAVCPVCTVAIGGGLLLSHYLGIDDLIVGIWIGGLILALGLWLGKSFKLLRFKGKEWFWAVFFWITTIWGLKLAGFIGHPTCKIHGHDKLLTGIIAGSIAFLISLGFDKLMRRMNKQQPGKAFFPYQKVILPLIWLLLATVIGAKICQLV